jgi:hypothetical protein
MMGKRKALLVAVVIFVCASFAGMLAIFIRTNVKEHKYENVQRVYIDKLHGTTLYVSAGEHRIEMINIMNAHPIFVIDVSNEKQMWAELKKCGKNIHGCLDIHVHSLNDIQHIGARETRSSE